MYVAVSEHFSENLHIIANEPSLAFYRIQEHVRKTLPQLLDKKVPIIVCIMKHVIMVAHFSCIVIFCF